VTWTSVPEPPPYAVRDPVTGEPGVRLEFRAEDGTLAAAEHRGATTFTWWDGLPGGVGQGGRGTVTLRACYRPLLDGPHVIGGGGGGRVGARHRERGVRPSRAGAPGPAGRTRPAGGGGERADDRGGERRHAGPDAVGGPGRGGRLRVAARSGDGHRAHRRAAR